MRTRIMKRLTAMLAALMALAVLCTVVTACTASDAASNLALAEPVYPETVKAPGENATDEEFQAYQDWNEKRVKAGEGNQKAMKAFYKKTLAQVLGASKAAGKDSGKNALYSPINVYLALAMLTETTDGDSRQQLLDLLGKRACPPCANACRTSSPPTIRTTGNASASSRTPCG